MYSLKKLVREIMEKIGSVTMGTSATTITGAIAEHESDISNLNSNLIRVTEVSLSKSVTLAGHTGSTVFDNYSLSSHIPSGATAVAAMYEWSSGSGCYAGNIAVANNKLTLNLYNGSNGSMSISSIRLLIFYTQ